MPRSGDGPGQQGQETRPFAAADGKTSLAIDSMDISQPAVPRAAVVAGPSGERSRRRVKWREERRCPVLERSHVEASDATCGTALWARRNGPLAHSTY